MAEYIEPWQADVAQRWPDRLRLGPVFDPARLVADLARLDETTWTPHFVPDHFDGDWSVLPLRSPPGALHPILQIAPAPNNRAWADTSFLECCPYIAELLATFACPVEAVRLMRLAPGSTIREHRDDDLAAEAGAARLHIPIATNPKVDFRLNGTPLTMEPGSLWYLRLAEPHSVTNAGDTHRVHLVIDVLVDAWFAALLDEAANL